MSQLNAATQLPAPWKRLAHEEKRSRRIKKGIRRRKVKTPGVDPATSALAADLRYVNDKAMPGIRRVGRPKRTRYVDPNGRKVSKADVLQRIRSLAIPPAWRDVWICPHPLGHLQATGRDARG